MSSEKYTHVAFADESNWNQKRFRSIALISAEVEDARDLHKKLGKQIRDNLDGEFKWSGCKDKKVLKGLAKFFFEHIDKIRMDAIIWDMNDSRHRDIENIDDIANFARMYYHLLHNVLKRRYPDEATWGLFPDKQKDIDWSKLEDCLYWKQWAKEENILTRILPDRGYRNYYNITEFKQCDSKRMSLIQLADFFAGISAYSYLTYERYKLWESVKDITPTFFNKLNFRFPAHRFKRKEKARFPAIAYVYSESRKRKLQVSLNSSQGLKTMNPYGRLNFWLYSPQHKNDKAPTKNKE